MQLTRLWSLGKILLQFLLPWNCLVGAFCFYMVTSSLLDRLRIDHTGSLSLALVFGINGVRRVVIGIQQARQGQARHALACFCLAVGYWVVGALFLGFVAPSLHHFFFVSAYEGYLVPLAGFVFILIGLRLGRGQLQSGCATSDAPGVCLPRPAYRTEE